MLWETVALFVLFQENEVVGPPARPVVLARAAAASYEVRIRLNGRISATQVRASDAGQARRLVQAQFGPKVTVLSVKRVD